MNFKILVDDPEIVMFALLSGLIVIVLFTLAPFTAGKVIGNGKIQQILPSDPRNNNQKKITQSQIYTLNEILKNNSKTTRYKSLASNPADLFAVILLDTNRLKLGQYLTEDGSTLQINKRNYFGPVNITRLKIKLLDDKGNVVNLNGLDFNFTLIAETLYQY